MSYLVIGLKQLKTIVKNFISMFLGQILLLCSMDACFFRRQFHHQFAAQHIKLEFLNVKAVRMHWQTSQAGLA